MHREGGKRIEKENQELMALREKTLEKKQEVEALPELIEQLTLEKAMLVHKLQNLPQPSRSSRSDSSASSSSSESSSEGWARCVFFLFAECE